MVKTVTYGKIKHSFTFKNGLLRLKTVITVKNNKKNSQIWSKRSITVKFCQLRSKTVNYVNKRSTTGIKTVNSSQKRSIMVFKKNQSINVKTVNYGHKQSITVRTVNYGKNGQLRSKTVHYSQKRSVTVNNGQLRSKTVNYCQKQSTTVKNGNYCEKWSIAVKNGQF